MQKKGGGRDGRRHWRIKTSVEQERLPPPQPYPWLLYFSGNRLKHHRTTFCSISDPTKTYSTPVLMPTPLPSGLFQHHINRLLVSNNELFRIQVVHAQDKVISVAIHRFDCSRRAWEKVESIKDRVFFVSNDYSPFACQAVNPETDGGRIYIALKDNNFVCIYNIEDNSLVISLPFSNLPKERSRSTWFMPDIENRMTDTLKEEIGKAHQIREKESICGAIHLKETWDKALNEFALPLDVVEVIAKHLIPA